MEVFGLMTITILTFSINKDVRLTATRLNMQFHLKYIFNKCQAKYWVQTENRPENTQE